MFITKKELNKRINEATRKAVNKERINNNRDHFANERDRRNWDEHDELRARIISCERKLGIPVENTWQNNNIVRKMTPIKFEEDTNEQK